MAAMELKRAKTGGELQRLPRGNSTRPLHSGATLSGRISSSFFHDLAPNAYVQDGFYHTGGIERNLKTQCGWSARPLGCPVC